MSRSDIATWLLDVAKELADIMVYLLMAWFIAYMTGGEFEIAISVIALCVAVGARHK